MRTGVFPGVTRLRHGVDHPPSSSAEVKEGVKLLRVGLHGLLQGDLYRYLFTYVNCA